MNTIKQITSLTNPTIKEIVLLSDKAKLRKELSKIVVEGLREISIAAKSGYKLRTLIFNPAIIQYNQILNALGPVIFDIEMLEVTNQVYNKIAYREGTEGVVAVFAYKNHTLEDLVIDKPNPFILVAEAPEKPGNIGALLRTCDAAGVDAFIIANPNTDLYNPNIIRSSVGGVFVNQIATGTTSEIIDFLIAKNIDIYCAALVEGATSCYEHDFTKSTAIVVGTESTGVSEEWMTRSKHKIMIPMAGQIDSMNVSVSAAILLFEAVRQRLKLRINYQ
jgi:RNA methyltransferase, TrmH family